MEGRGGPAGPRGAVGPFLQLQKGRRLDLEEKRRKRKRRRLSGNQIWRERKQRKIRRRRLEFWVL